MKLLTEEERTQITAVFWAMTPKRTNLDRLVKAIIIDGYDRADPRDPAFHHMCVNTVLAWRAYQMMEFDSQAQHYGGIQEVKGFIQRAIKNRHKHKDIAFGRLIKGSRLETFTPK